MLKSIIIVTLISVSAVHAQSAQCAQALTTFGAGFNTSCPSPTVAISNITGFFVEAVEKQCTTGCSTYLNTSVSAINSAGCESNFSKAVTDSKGINDFLCAKYKDQNCLAKALIVYADPTKLLETGLCDGCLNIISTGLNTSAIKDNLGGVATPYLAAIEGIKTRCTNLTNNSSDRKANDARKISDWTTSASAAAILAILRAIL